MNILILGATGTFGTALTKYLLENSNHNLTVFSRHADSVYKQSDRIRVFNGDASNMNSLKNAVKGQHVIYCAISGDVLPTVAQNLVTIMPDANVSRLLFMGAVGIYNEIPADLDGDDNLDNEPAQIPNRKAVDIIEFSELNYTILRPGYLKDGSEDDYVLTEKGEPAKGYITTIPSLTKLSLKLINDDSLFSRKSISITRNMI